MKESAIQKKIIDWLKANGYWVVKVITCNRNGTPDILACSPSGQFVAIEVKRPGGVASKLQDWNIRELTSRKAIAFVAWSLEDVIKCLS